MATAEELKALLAVALDRADDTTVQMRARIDELERECTALAQRNTQLVIELDNTASLLDDLRKERDVLMEMDSSARSVHSSLVETIKGMCERTAEMVGDALRERDEARREVCALDADTVEDQREYAAQRGWDCFREVRDGD